MRVLLCQTDIVWEDKAANFARVRALLEANRPSAGTLIVLPEMFATGFTMNADSIAEKEAGETWNFLAEIARTYQSFVLGGLVMRHEDGKDRNEAVCFTPEAIAPTRYTKLHPFTYGGEDKSYTRGNRLSVQTCGEFQMAPFICYDLRFPEVFRSAAHEGAELFVVIANWPQPRVNHWTTLLQARAIENQAYVVGVNRCGSDPHHHYSGGSIVVDPKGNVLADAGSGEAAVGCELHQPLLAAYRAEFPFLKDAYWGG